MMNQNERTESATAVALAVFDFFRLVGDEVVFDVNAAIDLIQAYGDRRAREVCQRSGKGKVVQLRLIRGFGKFSPRDCF